MTSDNYVLCDVGWIFRLSATLYRLLPRVLRNSAKIAHYASVNVAKLMPSGRAIVNTAGGKMCITPRHPADLQRAWGVWEIDLQSFIKKTLKNGHVFIDCGAHRGTYTIMASNLVGSSGKVISIEPFQDHFECLKFTAEQSLYDNISLVNAACGSTSGRAMFSEQERHIDEIGISVECVALDDVVSKADFIKIDTDGRELDILKGAKKLIQNGAQTIVEFSDFQYQSLDVLWRDAHTFMAELGCRPYVIRKDGSLGPEVYTVDEIKDRHVLFRNVNSPLENVV